jgi:DNA-binding GntR family transcriptional regulator
MLDLIGEPIIDVVEDRFGNKRADRVWHHVDRDHQEVLTYLEKRDQTGAREAMRAHLRSVRKTPTEIDKQRHVSKKSAVRR